MSTHTLAMAEEIADRIGIMDRGRLQFLGTVSELQQELSSHHTSLEALFLELTEGRRGDAETEGEGDEVGSSNGLNGSNQKMLGPASFNSTYSPSPQHRVHRTDSSLRTVTTASAIAADREFLSRGGGAAFWRMRYRIAKTLIAANVVPGAFPRCR